MNAVIQYIKDFSHAAKGRLTTYVALLTAVLAEVLGGWDDAAALLPAWVLNQKRHIVALSALLAIWTRVRRDLQQK